MRSSTFIGIRINSAAQVTDVNGIRRTIILTSENRNVDGSILHSAGVTPGLPVDSQTLAQVILLV
jgi:hypothetical protein